MGWGDLVTTDLFYKQLLEDTMEVFNAGTNRCGGVIGDPAVAHQLMRDLTNHGLGDRLIGYYGKTVLQESEAGPLPLRRIESLAEQELQALIVAADADKEDYLLASAPFVRGAPKVIIAGYGHFEFRDSCYWELASGLEEPSLANGYPNSRIHLYQCLANAVRLGLDGAVVEFGMFRGGTTMFLSRALEKLGCNWPILGFDTFSGFPPRKCFLDMYEHQDLSQVSLQEVRALLKGRDVRVIPGDIRETVGILENCPIVLGFVDTDNFTPAQAAIEAVRENVVPGGALVFDHLTGVDRFRYTLGERIAAWRLMDDPRFFNLHGTGVFIRQDFKPRDASWQ